MPRKKFPKKPASAFARAHAYAQAYRRGGAFAGHDVYTTDKAKAVLFIGRTAGLTMGKYREGQTIPEGDTARVVADLRRGFVGGARTGLTVLPGTGYYEGVQEPTTRIEIAWLPPMAASDKREPNARVFRKHVRQLAQAAAERLAQREIIIEWEGGNIRDTVESATPTRAPARTDNLFCSWVRQHSPSARSNPADTCYRETGHKKGRG